MRENGKSATVDQEVGFGIYGLAFIVPGRCFGGLATKLTFFWERNMAFG